MHPGVMSCPPDTPLTTVAEIMATHGVHPVVVVGRTAENLVWGVVTDADLVRAVPDGIDARRAGQMTRSPALVIEPAAPLAEAARLMSEHAATHLVVVDDERPVGVVSTRDVARVLARGGD